jgi:hypothetical protein
MFKFGIVVEGENDKIIIETLIRKILSEDHFCISRPTGGKNKLMTKFLGWLEDFKNRQVNKAIIIRDQDNQCIKEIIDLIRAKLTEREGRYRFGIKICIIKQEIDTWLMADENAISRVVGGKVPRVNENLEDIMNPKEKLQGILSRFRFNYTKETLRKIAEEANLSTIEYRCPGFKRFRESIVDC